MLKKIILIFFFLFILIKPLYASIEDKIIKNLIKTDNLTFNFKQTINEKTEEGKCIIEYPKKIFCLYNNYNKKIMVSNGRSLAIKNQVSNQYYLYPLKKTPLELILDKNFLINQIKESQGRTVNNKYINFTIIKNNNKI
ncbi:MAG TPA: outer-membrane lipoprotein carrier protein LolA, partial [Candidatus Pelagibacter bacterium]|nr:outer-membrane lipoprotein carrier protein LolA [Candidatus Pelagibacter bacterium]